MKKSKKIVISVFSALAAVALVVTGGILIVINFNVSSAPTVDIFDNGTSVSLSTQASTQYKGYRFRFQTAQNTFYIDSEVNNISLTDNDKIIPGTAYTISVCYLGEIEGSNSGYSQSVQWTAYDYLSVPVLTLDEEEDKLTWSAIENATYYNVYYGENFLRVTINEISLQELPAGKHGVFVVAGGGNGYRNSSASNTVEVKAKIKVSPFTSIRFDRDQLQVTLTGTENLTEFNVYIDEKAYKVTEFNKETLITGEYKYTFNIYGIYSNNSRIGAAPIIDADHILDGEILYLEEN